MRDLIIFREQQAVTSSLNVAETFGKRHDNVLRDIEGLLKIEGAQSMFFETKYEHDQNKQQYRMFWMTRDGFTLLAMGFTGKEAIQFKLKYIDAFNQMEKQMQQRLPGTYKEALISLLEEVEKRELLETTNLVLEQKVSELQPKADYTDTILKNTGLVTISQIAKDYGMSAKKMNELLHDLKVQFRQSDQWLLYSKYHDKGYTHSNTVNITRTDGRADIKMNTKWTQKGRLFLYDLLKGQGVIPMIERKGKVG